MKHFVHLRSMLLTALVAVSASVLAQGIWVETSLDELTSEDVFVIVDKTSSRAMSNDKGTSAAPIATAVTFNTDKTEITSEVNDNLKWTLTQSTASGVPTYTFYPNGDTAKWLYCTNSNNGVRVGTNDAQTFIIDQNFLKHVGTSRYVGVYSDQDWRCYTTIHNNIKNTVLAFYRYASEGGEGKQPTTLTFTPASAEVTYNTENADANTFDITTLTTFSSSNTDADAAITYAVTDGTAASITSEGIITLNEMPVGQHVVTITATSAETENFYGTTATFTLTILSLPTGDDTEAHFDLTKNNYPDATLRGGGSDIPTTGMWGKVRIEGNSRVANAANDGSSAYLSVFRKSSSTGGVFTISTVKEGDVITKVEFVGTQNVNVLVPSVGTFDATSSSGTWTGSAKSISFENTQSANDKQCRLTSVTVTYGPVELQTGTITLTDDMVSVTLAADSYDPSTNFTTNSDGAVTYELSEVSPAGCADLSADGSTIILNGAGSLFVTVSTDETEAYTAASETFLLDIAKATPEFSLKQDEVSVAVSASTYDLRSNLNVTSDAAPEFTVEAEPTTCATLALDGYTLEVNGEGTVLVTALLDEGTRYAAALTAGGADFLELEYLINLANVSMGNVATTIFHETFDKSTDDAGGNDGFFNNITGTGYNANMADEPDWTMTKAYGAKQCIKFGTASAQGSAQTRALTELSGEATLTFRAAAWDAAKEATTLNLSVTGGATITPTSVTMTKGEWTTFTATITNGTPETQVKFAANQVGNNRFFLDDIKITTDQYVEVLPTDLSARLDQVEIDGEMVYAGTYYNATKAYQMPEGLTGHIITQADGNAGTLTTEKIYNSGDAVPVGEALLITSATEQTAVKAAVVAATSTAGPSVGNLLKGSPGAGMMIAGDANHYYYKLSKSKSTGEPGFFWGNSTGEPFAMVNATTCYLEVEKPTNGDAVRGFAFGGSQTGIELTTLPDQTTAASVFDLQGRRVTIARNGLYIMNGKKILIK